ncbi:flagellar biosynthesis anti-sigma factor FlgM [Cupriavidus sp. USMAA2-4]|uniref:Negative regulator of flagellin synthesis n=1 Tax=Cupriavidus malaysiensis TaxID=367825 RepID=A0ABM6FB43_9BURK|nr:MULTISPECIES: flagellar biosynthesis anti-sigma factor FlgM [Cupriavidus]AOY95733.1 flagellar biosynthesis anti-sigma factor FlgM [Cupriavidus sp. USMAA2-4]AOZ03752.1 flagellar biosynthesis anti-sigma factor FlgM [Cupriavidus sp. USMAHM13]AOZ08879.1 flagellar biosynthesis anti-sigma factor FlgM [Cupriavidus malaysiensis]
MKINQSTSSRTGAPAEGTARATTAPAPAPATAAEVQTSPLSAQVRQIGASLSQDSDNDIDTARVEEIRQAIVEGRIKIDPSKIADGLLATLRELNQGQ